MNIKHKIYTILLTTFLLNTFIFAANFISATTLENSINYSIEKADYTKVNIAISNIPNELSYYTNESVEHLINVKNSIIWDYTVDYQYIVDNYATELNNSISSLALKNADYSLVDQAISRIPLDLSVYSSDSVANLISFKNAVIRDKKITEQDIVNSYANNIEFAINNLVYNYADYSTVDVALASIPRDLYNYTNDSVSILTNAKNAVIRNKPITEQELVNNYAIEINYAINNLQYKSADYSKVDEALKKVPSDLSKYTKDSAETLQKTINSIQRGKTILEQNFVNNYATSLTTAVSNLKLELADYTQINNIINKIPANLNLYTEKSVNNLNEIKNKIILDKKKSEQSIVDSYALELDNAIKNLEFKKADYTKLNKIVSIIPENLDNYTKESAKELLDIVNNIDYNKNIIEQQIVDDYCTTLEQAIANLEEQNTSNSISNSKYFPSFFNVLNSKFIFVISIFFIFTGIAIIAFYIYKESKNTNKRIRKMLR